MKCPVCIKRNLTPNYLDDLFRSHNCVSCGGTWLLVEDYIAWKERNPEHSFSHNSDFEETDTKKALLCPASGKVMQKYKIAHDSEHYLDFSASTGGIWLDKGEWEHLKERDLAGSLSSIFTSQWQKSIRNKNAELTFTALYQEKFGSVSYLKIKEIKQWINTHPNKTDLRAYLMAEDPYSVDK